MTCVQNRSKKGRCESCGENSPSGFFSEDYPKRGKLGSTLFGVIKITLILLTIYIRRMYIKKYVNIRVYVLGISYVCTSTRNQVRLVRRRDR